MSRKILNSQTGSGRRKRLLKIFLIAACIIGVALLGLEAIFLKDAWLIRLDLHLGLSPCVVAAPASGPQIIRVAVAAITDKKKQELRSRYHWEQINPPDWYDQWIPWYSDLDDSTEFEPVFRHARGPEHQSNQGKYHATITTKKWKYELVLDDDRNILWIVRDQPGT